MKRLPSVIISPRQLENDLFEYTVFVGDNNSVLLYVYSVEEEEEEAIKDWTILWWDSIKPKNNRILN